MIGEPKINSEFPTGNLDAFLNEMSQPKQDMNIDEKSGLEDLEGIQKPEDEIKANLKMKTPVANASGKLIATVIDTTLPAILGFVAQEESTIYKVDNEDREELERALSEYMKLKGGDIPPGMMVLILVLSLYGTKIPIALQHRKLNKEREELQRMKEDLLQKQKGLEQKEHDLDQKTIERELELKKKAQSFKEE